MPELLFLVHRIPYPPNKGDKIRSFHLMRHLSKTHRVRLGCFFDDAADAAHVEALSAWCAEVHALPLVPLAARLRSLHGLVAREPLTLPYYRDERMDRWVRGRLDVGVSRVLVFSSAMAQYLRETDYHGRRVVVDFVDVDSDKWRQYAPTCRFPMNRIYRREARRLLAFERQVAARAAASIFVSKEEAALFRSLAPESASRVYGIDNGVDTEFFAPGQGGANPYPPGERHLVFTGAMDYRANVDAVCWFADVVFPRILEQVPEARFTIVGSRPAAAVQRLARHPGIRVTGTVQDVRPWQAHAAAAVAPLRIARGIQNKVLEAMAMALPVVVTPQAIDGLDGAAGLDWQASEDPGALAARALDLLRDPTLARQLGAAGRACVLTHYGWGAHLDRFTALLGEAVPPAPRAALGAR